MFFFLLWCFLTTEEDQKGWFFKFAPRARKPSFLTCFPPFQLCWLFAVFSPFLSFAMTGCWDWRERSEEGRVVAVWTGIARRKERKKERERQLGESIIIILNNSRTGKDWPWMKTAAQHLSSFVHPKPGLLCMIPTHRSIHLLLSRMPSIDRVGHALFSSTSNSSNRPVRKKENAGQLYE